MKDVSNINKKHIRNDIILVIFMVCAALLFYYFLYLKTTYSDSSVKQVQILVNGELIESYNFPDDLNNTEHKEITLQCGNVLIIDGPDIYISEADCPDKLCIKQGKISHNGQSLICLPNKLIIRIVNLSDEEQGLDVMPR